MMVGEKKEGWINLYRTDALEIITGNRIFETKDMGSRTTTPHSLTTDPVKIERYDRNR